MKLKAVLVGTGGWAETHARAYQTCEEIELAGICGHRNRERLDALADRYTIPKRSLDLAELLDCVRPDILDIACNPHFRLEGMRLGMQPYIRLINVEKPLALAPADAYAIRDLCVTNGKLLTINHQKKFLPAWQKAAALVHSGTLGEVRHIRATCQGNLLEQGTHLVDMALHFMQYRPVRWVMGQIDELQGLDKEGASAPDAALALLCFDDNVRATMTLGTIGHTIPGETNKWHQYGIEVYGSAGHLTVSLNRTLEITSYTEGRRTVEESSWNQDYILAETRHLDAAARYARDPQVGHLSDLAHSLKSFEVIMAVYASGCGEGRVELPRHFDNTLIERLMQLHATGKCD